MICINRGSIKNLTVGKKYQVTKTNSGDHYGSDKSYFNVWVINDKGIERHYSGKRFISIDEYRDKQLNEVFNNMSQ